MAALRDSLFGTGADALEQGQMDTLDLLATQASWRMSDLAEALRVDPSTATRAMQRLVNVGLACRKPSDDDGRVVMAAITAAGLLLGAMPPDHDSPPDPWPMAGRDDLPLAWSYPKYPQSTDHASQEA